MREIEFKAKRVEGGVWVYGDLIQLDTQLCIAGVHQWAGVPANNSIEIDVTKVIPETVGQYTGLSDKQGVKIFEGDILKYTEHYGYRMNSFTNAIYFENGCFGFRSSFGYFTAFGDFDELKEDFLDHIEVISNIHDKAQQKQALIDMMRGDEEIGLYDDNPKNH